MKIGFLGNTNNYPFRLAWALRKLGHDVLFFVDRPRSEPRHRPESHYQEMPYPYPNWIREIQPVNPLQIVLYPWTLKSVFRALDTCDGVVLNGLALSLGQAVRRPLIGLLTGSDLDVFANPRSVVSLASAPYGLEWLAKYRLLDRLMFIGKQKIFADVIRLQRAGIAKCCLLDYAIPGLLPEGDALLEEMGINGRRRTTFMLTDIDHLPAPRARQDGAIRIFCATRLQWKRPAVGSNLSPLDMKGTDTMLEGLRLFVQRSSRPVQIRLIAVGADVEAARQVVQELGLEPYVCWLPQLTQSDFHAEMVQADVILENFGPDCCMGMAGRDAIAMGVPVVASGKSELFARVLGEPLPIYEAQKPDEICARLNEIATDPSGVAQYASRARSFAARWFSPRRAAEQCVAAFEKALSGEPTR